MEPAVFREFAPEIRLVASEAYRRACYFVEGDPQLVGGDRQFLKAVMADRICDLIKGGEHGTIRLANAAISTVRKFIQEPQMLRTAA